MGAAMKVHKEGELVVMDIEEWNTGLIQRLSAVTEWARDSDRQGLRTTVRLEVPKEHFIELWKLWSQVPPTESELSEWTKWLREE